MQEREAATIPAHQMRTVEDAKSVLSKSNNVVLGTEWMNLPTRQKAPNRQLGTASAALWILIAEVTHTASKINARRSSPREPLASSLHGVPQENAPPTHAVPWAEMVTRRMSLGRDPQSRRYTSSTHWGWAK